MSANPLDIVDTDNVLSVCAVANTPAYLVKQLGKLQEVADLSSELARERQRERAIEFLTRYASGLWATRYKERNPVVAYAVIRALAPRGHEDQVRLLFQSLARRSNDPWLAEIAGRMLLDSRSAQVAKPKVRSVPFSAKEEALSATSPVTLPPRSKVYVRDIGVGGQPQSEIHQDLEGEVSDA